MRYDGKDVRAYLWYLNIRRLAARGYKASEIERTLRTTNVGKYLRGEKKSFLTNLAFQRGRLGPPLPGFQWLPIELKPRGTPGKDWIQVPKRVRSFRDLLFVLEQCHFAGVNQLSMKAFGYRNRQEVIKDRSNLFGFLLGAIVGDAGKHAKGVTRFSSRSLSLVLSKNKPNSFRFGEFFSICGNASLNLGVHRVGDLPVSSRRYGKTECYYWISSSSPLISWIFNECLGLKDGETTTYDPLRMDWLLSAPRQFRIHFVQGLAESDAWPDAADDVVKLVSSPNTELLKKLLESLGCHAKIVKQPLVQLLRCTTEEADRVPFFSPRIASNLYRNMRALATARRYPNRTRIPEETIRMIQTLAKTAPSGSEVCLRLAMLAGYKVSGDTVRKYASKTPHPNPVRKLPAKA